MKVLMPMTPEAENVLRHTRRYATSERCMTLDVHLLHCLLEIDDNARQMLVELGINVGSLLKQVEGCLAKPHSNTGSTNGGDDPSFVKTLSRAEYEAGITKSDFVHTDHLLIALAAEPAGHATNLIHWFASGVDYVKLREVAYGARRKDRELV